MLVLSILDSLDFAQDALKNIGIIIGASIVYLAPKIEKWYKLKNKKGSFAETLEISVRIQKELDFLCARLSSSRIAILDYHNGTSTYSGLPFNFCSMSYEALDVTTKSIINDFQGIPINPIVNMLLELEKSPVGFVSVTDVDSDRDIAITQRTYGVKTAYNFKISSSVTDGVLSIVWVDDYTKLSDYQLEEIYVSLRKIDSERKKIKKH